MVSIAVINTITKISMGRKMFSLACRLQPMAEAQEGKQRQTLKHNLWRNTIFHGLTSLISYTTQTHLPRGAMVHSRLDPPTSKNQENT